MLFIHVSSILIMLRWVYTIKVNLVKVGQFLTNFDQDAVYTVKVVQNF